MNGPFRFEKSIVFLLLLALLSSCSPKKTDPVRSMPGTDEALTEEASAGGGFLYETIADPNTSYAAYTLDQGAVSFFLPEDWDLYMDGGSVLAFQKGSAYFQAERVRTDGEEKSLHEVIDQERSLWFENGRSAQSEIIEIAGFEGIVSAFGKDYEGGRAGSLYLGAFSIRGQYYVLYYQSPIAYAGEEYEAFKDILGRVRAAEKLVPSALAEGDSAEEPGQGRGTEEPGDGEKDPAAEGDLAVEGTPVEEGNRTKEGNVSTGEESRRPGSAAGKEKLPGSEAYRAFSLKDLPEYDSSPWAEVNGGIPFFTEDEMTAKAFQDYSPLDDLGRCGRAMACLGPETMPDQPRGSIGMIKPSGWQIARYKDIDGTYLYNRCHLIGYQLSGQNANTLNLITGTRYMNMAGMEPFESRTAGYIETTGHHVLYRVTPVFEGEDLVARGVLLEARSVEDQDLQFCVYCYNVQPGIDIDYSDGSSRGKGYMGSGS